MLKALTALVGYPWFLLLIFHSSLEQLPHCRAYSGECEGARAGSCFRFLLKQFSDRIDK